MSRLLIIEDEAHIASGLRYNLEADGHEVTWTDNGEAALAELETESKTRYVSPQWPAMIHAALSEKEIALQYLEKACEVRAIQLLWLGVDPNFDALRSEPEFAEILNRHSMGGLALLNL